MVPPDGRKVAMKARGGPCAARLALLAAVLSASLACSDDEQPCAAGTTRVCTCDDGASGRQTCATDGSHWRNCECTGTDADADADADAEADADADSTAEAEAEVGADSPADGSAHPCLDPGPGTVDAPVSVGDRTPLLSGGPVADGRYELSAVVLYAWAAVTDRVTRFVADSNGNTRGAVVFRDGAWGMAAQLDLFLSLSLEGVGGVELDVATSFEAAGPFEAADGVISTEPGVCAVAATADCRLDGSFRYEAAMDVVAVEVVWAKECITSLLPRSYRLYSGMWLGTDMPVVLRFARAAR
jgi:hypothetical protein